MTQIFLRQNEQDSFLMVQPKNILIILLILS